MSYGSRTLVVFTSEASNWKCGTSERGDSKYYLLRAPQCYPPRLHSRAHAYIVPSPTLFLLPSTTHNANIIPEATRYMTPAQICGYIYGRAASGRRSCKPITSAKVVGRMMVAKARASVEGSSVRPATSTQRGLMDYCVIVSLLVGGAGVQDTS
jgi:hypothetical protein